MRLWVCGVRGSTPAPGPEFVRFGGHTSCVAVGADDHPTLVLDAGTGIRRLATVLGGRPFAGALLFGHLHWDHTQGLPFASALDNDGASVDCFLPAQADGALSVLTRAMSPPHFPIEPTQLRGSWRFHDLEEGELVTGALRVTAREIPHKGGRTFGYRITDGTATLAYLSDHSPISIGAGPDGWGEYHEAALALCADADVVLHDSQYTRDELPARAAWGHSAVDYAVRLCEISGARRLLLFHHDPSRTDDELAAIAEEWRHHMAPRVEPAYEGLIIDI